MQCPKCHSSQSVKYGRTHYGKQRFRCQDCKRQFVEHPSRQPVDPATRDVTEQQKWRDLQMSGFFCPHRKLPLVQAFSLPSVMKLEASTRRA